MNILVSGAGIAGSTVAWYLAKTGAKATIVEKAKDFLAQGQNIDVSGAAISQ